MKNKKIKIGLVGWNGKRNVGDDAMTAAIINYCRTHNPKSEFVLTGDDKELAIYTENLQDEKSIIGFKNYNFFIRKKGIRRIYNKYLFPHFFANKKLDLILIGGGSIIQSAGNSKRLFRIIDLAKKKNPALKVGALGISVGPFKNEISKIEAKKILNRLEFLVVRDQRSFDLIDNFDLKCTYSIAPDLALTLSKIRAVEFDKKANQKSVGVSLRIGHFSKVKLGIIKNVLNYLMAKHHVEKIKIFNFCDLKGQQDQVCTNRMIKALSPEYKSKIEIINFSYDPLDFYHQINNCSLMLCMRLHASIISYAVKTPFLIMPYHQKCIDFGKQIAGLNDDSFLYDEDDENAIYKKVDQIVNEEIPQFGIWETVVEDANNQFKFLENIFNESTKEIVQ